MDTQFVVENGEVFYQNLYIGFVEGTDNPTLEEMLQLLDDWTNYMDM